MNSSKFGGSSLRYAKISLMMVLAVFVFLLSVDLLISSLSVIGKDTVQNILSIATNPFISLFIGLVSTAILQSSSTSTSMIVAMVASGSLELSHAVPMILGANIGTTLTSNIVAISYIAHRKKFRKALTVATSHDFFNIMATCIVFPLEYYYQLLSKSASFLAEILTLTKKEVIVSPEITMSLIDKMPFSEWILKAIDNSFIILIISILLIILSIRWLSRLMLKQMIGNEKEWFSHYIFKNSYKSFFWGGIVTAAVQSSSITTSLVVPVVAGGQARFKRVFPFIIGANIGTTITALIAALFKNEAAVSIAIAHFIFNMLGMAIFLPIKPLRRIPMRLAVKLGKVTEKNLMVGFIYLVLCFFLLPFLLILLST
ncbi:MAG: Na/Pi symporter [Cyclobacteriaceae bacterium]|nr:Na/Pi symporter [Cyclobacteriaceae bacterium]